jgi:hypothetical protein
MAGIMKSEEEKIRHVVFYLGLRPGNLMLVEMTDGRFRILHNDVQIQGEEWESDELEGARARYNEWKAKLLPC